MQGLFRCGIVCNVALLIVQLAQPASAQQPDLRPLFESAEGALDTADDIADMVGIAPPPSLTAARSTLAGLRAHPPTLTQGEATASTFALLAIGGELTTILVTLPPSPDQEGVLACIRAVGRAARECVEAIGCILATNEGRPGFGPETCIIPAMECGVASGVARAECNPF